MKNEITGFKCPICNSLNTRVVGNRKKGNVVYRYRLCDSCNTHFKTNEYYTDKTLEEVRKWKEQNHISN